MFGPRFSGSACKTKLKLVTARIKLVRNKRREAIKKLKREIASLLANKQEPSARIRVEHVIREENTVDAYDLIELFCELIAVRMPIIESQKKDCPRDLKEAISSIIWAAPRCADLPELVQVRALFGALYGKEFLAAATELRPECGVNRKIITTLSTETPLPKVKLELLQKIAKDEGVDWDSSTYEKEIGDPYQDLLDEYKHSGRGTGGRDPPVHHQGPPPVYSSSSDDEDLGRGGASSSNPPPPPEPKPARAEPRPPPPPPPPPPTDDPLPPPRPPPEDPSPPSSPEGRSEDNPQFIPFVPPLDDDEFPGPRPMLGVGSVHRRPSMGRDPGHMDPGADRRSRQRPHSPKQDQYYGTHPDVAGEGAHSYSTAQAAADASSKYADKAVNAAVAAQRLAAQANIAGHVDVEKYLTDPSYDGRPHDYPEDPRRQSVHSSHMSSQASWDSGGAAYAENPHRPISPDYRDTSPDHRLPGRSPTGGSRRPSGYANPDDSRSSDKVRQQLSPPPFDDEYDHDEGVPYGGGSTGGGRPAPREERSPPPQTYPVSGFPRPMPSASKTSSHSSRGGSRHSFEDLDDNYGAKAPAPGRDSGSVGRSSRPPPEEHHNEEDMDQGYGSKMTAPGGGGGSGGSRSSRPPEGYHMGGGGVEGVGGYSKASPFASADSLAEIERRGSAVTGTGYDSDLSADPSARLGGGAGGQYGKGGGRAAGKQQLAAYEEDVPVHGMGGTDYDPTAGSYQPARPTDEYEHEQSYRPARPTGPPSEGYGIGIQSSPFDYDKVDDDDFDKSSHPDNIFPPAAGTGVGMPRRSAGGSSDHDNYQVVHDAPPSGLVSKLSPPPGRRTTPLPPSSGRTPIPYDTSDLGQRAPYKPPKAADPAPIVPAPSIPSTAKLDDVSASLARQKMDKPEDDTADADDFTKRMEALRRSRD